MMGDLRDALIAFMVAACPFFSGTIVFDLPILRPLTDVGLNVVTVAI